MRWNKDSGAIREEHNYWETLKKDGEELELRYARDLPDDTPHFILDHIAEFEKDVARYCFSGACGRILDVGCGNGNLLVRALKIYPGSIKSYTGMDFSMNMLSRAKVRCDHEISNFAQGSIDSLPFRDSAFDTVICSGVLTCLPTENGSIEALRELYRVLKPGGMMTVDFFNSSSHFTRIRKQIMRDKIEPPEYVSPSIFRLQIEDAGFAITGWKGFDFKPFQGYLFMSRLRCLDPGFVQERFSRLVESKVVPRFPLLSLLGYRIYVKCIKK